MSLGGVVGIGASRAFQQLRDAESVLRSDIWERYVALAQRRALIWWQKRRVPPGVAARFTKEGIPFYGFGSRSRKPYSLPPYYHVRGDLSRAILARKPKTSRTTGQVVSRLAFGGGVLNFMLGLNMRPVVGWTRSTRTLTESFTVGAYTRPWRRGSSTTVSVSSYSVTRQRTVVRHTPTRGGDSYATAFGRFTKDRPAIEVRVAIELRNIVRSRAFTKGGDFRKSVLRPLQTSAVAT